ncbi:uncharacterized protein DUF1624 [Brevibacterium sanguinis]|uniref:Uncharacterized protein DUF1624 n=2 Tax=Brevibacterium TaxID=1696 RepID=A0A366INS0_9MICO|nr:MULTISPECIES: heparan-alpha-glucosaminide N-acetyltransferase domain-containing protein [Brevibacterium]RBP67868.1 uncharacterized protein DUF1624 [Brevibacterium sanguinis]RBP74715.1 uncharacterized protein DUF1624 [Brevibacterium celere]
MRSDSGPTSATVLDRLSPPGRLIGLDAARGLALFAMMITHIISMTDPAGMPTWASEFSGKASALFAVLAGCSLVLSTRSRLDRPGAGLRDVAGSVLIRAAAITAIGLCLGTVSSLLAVILVNYGVMFAIAMLFLRLRAGALFAIALTWMGLGPVVSMLVRSEFELTPSYLPMSWFDLATPPAMLTDLVLTGYYPILQWLSYILLGMACAKLDISRHLPALIAAGGAMILVGTGASWLLLGPAGGEAILVEDAQRQGIDLGAALHTGSFGVTATTSWWWLAIAGPHSGTPFDLLFTSGTSVVTIAACQMLAGLLGRSAWVLAPVSAPGSMPLTVYSAHVVLIELTHPLIGQNPAIGSLLMRETAEYALHALGFAVLAIVWKLTVSSHGPLESGISVLIRAWAPKPEVETKPEA